MKRNCIVTTVLLAVFLLPGLLQAGLFSKSKKDKPNIIYILADDLGYGDLSCYGQKKFKTPHIDRLAKEGMKFTDHYSGSTVCAPSRCSLMTGLHTGHAQVKGNKEVRPEGQGPMRADTVTIPRLLRKAGYVSGMFGKWGLGFPGSVSEPMEHFDRFYGYNCQRQAHNYYPAWLWSDRKKVKMDRKTYSHDIIQNEAFKFIRKNKKKPFFCYMSIAIPHAAMQAPKELHEKYRKLFPEHEDKVARYLSVRDQITNPIAAFPAMVEHMDNGVGQLLELLKELKIDENTLVIFTSDNGAHKEGGHEPDFWDSNGPFRGYKRDLTEGGIRAPFIARWPGKVQAGTTSDHISAFWDMLPTFCEMAGVEVPAETDGISMLPELLGKEQKEHEYLYWWFKRRIAVRKGKWKALGQGNRVNELYDLSTDIGESKNLVKKHPEVVAEMRKIMVEGSK